MGFLSLFSSSHAHLARGYELLIGKRCNSIFIKLVCVCAGAVSAFGAVAFNSLVFPINVVSALRFGILIQLR